MFSRPGDVLHARYSTPTTTSQFGCTDCLLKNGVDAPQNPLYLHSGTYLCSEHVSQRLNAPIFNVTTKGNS